MEKGKRKIGTYIVNFFIFLVIIIVSLFMYAKYVGTSGLIVKEYRVSSDVLPESFSGVKIVQFTDLLYKSTINKEEIEYLVNSINELKPDIVVFTGNLVREGYQLQQDESEIISNYLSEINATLGKYYVSGDLDDEISESVLNDGGFINLTNKYEYIYNKDNSPICLVGVGSYNLGVYKLEESFSYTTNSPNVFSVMITHEGDIIDKVLELPIKPNLILSGNSLGGEINLPFIGEFYKFDGSINYYKEHYLKEGSNIYISSGLGTRKGDKRLFNRPSITLYRLNSNQN